MFCLGEGAEGWVESEEDILRRWNSRRLRIASMQK